MVQCPPDFFFTPAHRLRLCRPSEYGYNSQGDIVKIRRTMSGRIYGAVFERLEKIPPPVGGGALAARRSSSGRRPSRAI